MTIETKNLGKEGEHLAEKFLKENGYKIIKTNYRFGKGEIDIIAEDPEDKFLVFVEVKTRNTTEYGTPESAVTPGKIRQIKKIAELYLYENEIHEQDCRFDVIAIVLNYNKNIELTHYKSAFM